MVLLVSVYECGEKAAEKQFVWKQLKRKKKLGYTVENYVCASVFLFFTFPSSVVFVFHYISIMHLLPSSIIYDFLFKANKKESKKGALKNIVETTEQMKKKPTWTTCHSTKRMMKILIKRTCRKYRVNCKSGNTKKTNEKKTRENMYEK